MATCAAVKDVDISSERITFVQSGEGFDANAHLVYNGENKLSNFLFHNS